VALTSDTSIPNISRFGCHNKPKNDRARTRSKLPQGRCALEGVPFRHGTQIIGSSSCWHPRTPRAKSMEWTRAVCGCAFPNMFFNKTLHTKSQPRTHPQRRRTCHSHTLLLHTRHAHICRSFKLGLRVAMRLTEPTYWMHCCKCAALPRLIFSNASSRDELLSAAVGCSPPLVTTLTYHLLELHVRLHINTSSAARHYSAPALHTTSLF
jgi:hypothetical protein